MERTYQCCTRCVMDTSDPAITFDQSGECNHCRRFDRLRQMSEPERGNPVALEAVVAQIKEDGQRSEYDCLVGVSGGMDSSFLLYKAVELGLRPLAVHVDNGWNSELAVGNIQNLVQRLDVDLLTEVLDWETFKRLQVAFLRASVPDAELPTDHAIRSITFRVASKYGIRHILNGRNLTTEGILPWSWTYSPLDGRYISRVHKSFDDTSLRRFPLMPLPELLFYVFGRRIRGVSLLNYVDYSKKEANEMLASEVGWRDYGGKHYESRYTRFFQAHILPEKFGIDKRRAHLSVLLCNGEMTRSEAVKELDRPLYSIEDLRHDTEYVTKKLGLSRAVFDEIMAEPPKSFRDYGNNAWVFLLHENPFLLNVARRLETLGVLPQKLSRNFSVSSAREHSRS